MNSPTMLAVAPPTVPAASAATTNTDRIPMLPLGDLAVAVAARLPGFAAALVPICVRDGAVDWLCSDCGFVIFQGLVHPERLRYLTVRCPNCDVYQRSLS